MAYHKQPKKITWTAPAGGVAEFETEAKKAFRPPPCSIAGGDFATRQPGDLIILAGSADSYYDAFYKHDVKKSPHRWLVPAYSAYSDPETIIKGAFGIYAGIIRTQELKDADAKIVTSRLRHTLIVEGERFIVHNDFGLQFLDADPEPPQEI